MCFIHESRALGQSTGPAGQINCSPIQLPAQGLHHRSGLVPPPSITKLRKCPTVGNYGGIFSYNFLFSENSGLCQVDTGLARAVCLVSTWRPNNNYGCRFPGMAYLGFADKVFHWTGLPSRLGWMASEPQGFFLHLPKARITSICQHSPLFNVSSKDWIRSPWLPVITFTAELCLHPWVTF